MKNVENTFVETNVATPFHEGELNPQLSSQNGQETGKLEGRSIEVRANPVLDLKSILLEQNMQVLASAKEISTLAQRIRTEASEISRRIAALERQIFRRELNEQTVITSVHLAKESQPIIFFSAHKVVKLIEKGLKASSKALLESVKTMIECDSEHLCLIKAALSLYLTQETHTFNPGLEALKNFLLDRKGLFDEWKKSEELSEEKQESHEEIQSNTDLALKFEEFATKQKEETKKYCINLHPKSDPTPAAEKTSRCSIM